MAKIKVAQVPKPGADFEIVEREIPQPGPGADDERQSRISRGANDVRTKQGANRG
jgi:hypothetical protein